MRHIKHISYLLLFVVDTVCTVVAEEDTPTTTEPPSASSVQYGVDISYPMHHKSVSTNYPWLPHNQDPSVFPVPLEYQGMAIQPLGGRQSFYENLMAGCQEKYSNFHNRCEMNDQVRVAMNLRQPASMRNYTKLGFTKIRAPEHIFALLQKFWERNRHRTHQEVWPPGNIFTNHWESPNRIVSVETRAMIGGGPELKRHIWNAARESIQEWTGQRLVECSMYGIRVYETGAVLAPHIDRLPLVSSAILNVDQDVDEPWPLEVIGHDGKAYNVTMVPGDMVLYESHSVLHGRPFPLKGRFMANVFIHFEPIGPIDGPIEYTGDLPPYLIPGSEEERYWRESNPEGHKLVSGEVFVTGSTDAHLFASKSDLRKLQEILDRNGTLVNARDVNGWTPLHEAVQQGDSDIVRLLLERGANANVRAGPEGDGGSPLFYVHKYHKEKRLTLIAFHQLKNLLQEFNAELHKPIHNEHIHNEL